MNDHVNYDEKRDRFQRLRRLMMQQSGTTMALTWYRRKVGKRRGRRNRQTQTLTLPPYIAKRLNLRDPRITVEGRVMMSCNGRIGLVA